MKKIILFTLLLAASQVQPCPYNQNCNFQPFGPYDYFDALDMVFHELIHTNPEFLKCVQDNQQDTSRGERIALAHCAQQLSLNNCIAQRAEEIFQQCKNK